MKSHVTIIIPARHESEGIVDTLSSLAVLRVSYEVIVVSDAVDVSDTTEQIVSEYGRAHPHVRLIRKHIGKDSDGFAGALFRGARVAKSSYVVFVMADLCDEPRTIDTMYRTIEKGWDVVCGSRYMRGGKKSGGPRIQGFFSWFVNTTLHILTRIPTTDASNSFKMYRKEVLETLAVDPTLGVEASLDMIFQAYRRGARITEVPTRWTGRTKGVSKFRLLRQLVQYGRIYIQAIV